jgi:hypothetical protein
MAKTVAAPPPLAAKRRLAFFERYLSHVDARACRRVGAGPWETLTLYCLVTRL